MNGQTDKTIAPIQTRYKGYHFRSRLEARWAVFFDALGIKWDYEKEGYDINGTWYLPDFWLPELGVFVEIKPTLQKDMEFYRDFSYKINRAIILICGTPWEYDAIFFGWESNDGGGGVFSSDCIFTADGPEWSGLHVATSSNDSTIFISEWDTSRHVIGYSETIYIPPFGWTMHFDWEEWREYNLSQSLAGNAATKSKSSRFEFKESGPT